METIIIDGKKIAGEIESEAREIIASLKFRPVIVDIIVGYDPVTEQFVGVKRRAAERIGFGFELRRFEISGSSNQADSIISSIGELNSRKEVCGIIVQLPLPFEKEISASILSAIDLARDIDCLSPVSQQKFYERKETYTPPAAAAVMRLLESIPQDLSQKKYLVLGQGYLVGRPAQELLQRQGVSLEAANAQTGNTEQMLLEADVIISGAGRAGLITGDKVKPGCVIIDAGTSEAGGVIRGDVDRESVMGVAAYLAPVPGGVGPVAVACVMMNAAIAAAANI